MTTDTPVSADEAKEALSTIENVQSASRRRAAPPRLFGAAIATLVATGFALYAQESPGDFPGLFIVLGTVLLVAHFRDKTGVNARAFPDSSLGRWSLLGVVVVLCVLFFGGIYVRRAYDVAWIPVVTGLIAGGLIYWLAASEQRGTEGHE
jgi:uncharacterized membrane protein YjjP (DUF1212 family)